MAAVLLGLSCSFSYSETTYGVTNNAAANGLSWNMGEILPSQLGLVVNGVIYNYTVQKEVEDPFIVHVQNENSAGDGYVFRETDDWSGVPGARINKLIGLNNVPALSFGEGSIETEGIGSIVDPRVVYTYKVDECYNPLSDPSCPGYLNALYAWLKEKGFFNGELQPEDPFYDEWVQASLKRELKDLEEDELTRREDEENEEEDEQIKALNVDVTIDKLVNGADQSAMIAQMSTIPNFESYYAVNIQGGVYNDTVVLQDSTLSDNARAMRSLASDETHTKMIRSQYEN